MILSGSKKKYKGAGNSGFENEIVSHLQALPENNS